MDKKNLLLLFDRPQEPIFIGKGQDGKTVFDVPHNFITDRYRPIAAELQNRFGETADNRIPIRNISTPDLSLVMSLERHAQFSLFIPRHRAIAGRLIDIFMSNVLILITSSIVHHIEYHSFKSSLLINHLCFYT